MDINQIIKLVQSIPKDKLTDEKTLKKVMANAAKESGKKLSDEELDKLVKGFYKIVKGGNTLPLISQLMKSGIKKSQIDDIHKKMNKS